MALRVEPRSGEALRLLLPQLARLRIEVFRDWPYLYEGSLDYEGRYLAKFLEAPDHLAVCAFDGERLVGASTAAPMRHQHAEFAEPFRRIRADIGDILYFGESILERDYRGRGIGHAFFDGREAHAAALGLGKTAFCGVMRPADHPSRPADYVPLDAFWTKRGYRPLDGVIASFGWKDLDEDEETEKPMQFWGRGF